jgi:hypothetical protein
MIKNYFLFAIFLFSSKGFSQEIYVKTGKNFTKYNYTNELLQSSSNLQSGSGNSYELGFTNPLLEDNISYSVSLFLDGYNAIGGSTANSYSWDTQYIGVLGKLEYSFFPDNNFVDFLLNCGVDASTIIYGKQEINGSYYDLVHQKEFSGIWVGFPIGAQAKFEIQSFGYLSLGYNFSQNFNLSNNTKEKLSFSTQQIQLGFHFPIN